MQSLLRLFLCFALATLTSQRCLGLSSVVPPAAAYTEAFYTVHAWSASPFRADGSPRSRPGPVYQFDNRSRCPIESQDLGVPSKSARWEFAWFPNGPLFGLNGQLPLVLWPTSDGLLIAAANPCRDQTQLCSSAMRPVDPSSSAGRSPPRSTTRVPDLPSIALWHEPLNPASGSIGVAVRTSDDCPMVTFTNLARTSDQDQLWHSELIPGRLTGQVELCGNGTMRLRYLSVPPQPGDVLPETVSHEPYANTSSAPRLITHDAGAGQAPFVGLAGPLNLTVTLPPPRWRGGRLTATAFEVTPSALQQPIKRLPSGRVVQTIPQAYGRSVSCEKCTVEGGVWCAGTLPLSQSGSDNHGGRCMHPMEAKLFCTQVGALATGSAECDGMNQRLRDLKQPYSVIWRPPLGHPGLCTTAILSFNDSTIEWMGETCRISRLSIACPSRAFHFLSQPSPGNETTLSVARYGYFVRGIGSPRDIDVVWVPLQPPEMDGPFFPILSSAYPLVMVRLYPAGSIAVTFDRCGFGSGFSGSYAIPHPTLGTDGLVVSLARSVIPLPVRLNLTPISPCPVCRRGTCGGNQTRCVCPEGFAGPSCDRCSSGYFESGGDCVRCPACVNGTCSPTGACDCSAGFGGPLCATKCPPCPACDQRHGACVCGVCECADGWSGALCDAAPSGSPAFASSTMYIVVGSVGAAAAVAGAIVVLLCCCRRAAPAVKEPTQAEMREAFTSAVSLVDDAASDAPSSVGALPTDGGPGHELLEPSTPSAPPSSPAKIRLPVRGGRRRARPSFVTFKDSRMSSSASFDIL